MAARRFKNRSELEFWLGGRRREDAIVIAARAALRVLPLVADAAWNGADEQAELQFAALTLATFRASASAQLVAKYPARADAVLAATGAAFDDAIFAAAAARTSLVGAAAVRVAAYAAARSAAAAAAAARTSDGARTSDTAALSATAVARSAAAAHSVTVIRRHGGARVFSSAEWVPVSNDAALLDTIHATALASAKLWVGEAPEWVENAWADLRSELPPDQKWVVWVEWYEAILAGRELWPTLDPKVREDLEVEIVSLPNSVWEQGPTTANAAIDALIKAAHTPAIVAQGPGPRYGLGDLATIVPVEHWEYDGEGNIPKRIESLLPLTRRSVQDLSACLPPNDPHNLARDTREYLAAIDRDVRQIDWAVVYGLGVFVENAAAEAERDIADRLTPPFEGPAKKALDSLRTLHSNLIMASGEGRALQEQADALRLTRDQHQALRVDAQTIAAGLDSAPDVATPAAAATVARATREIGQGSHPERGSEFGLAAMGNVSVVLVSAATLASFVPIGLAAGGVVGAAMGGGVAWVGYEGLKKSAMYSNATAALGPRYDALHKTADEALRARLIALAPFRRFVRDNEAPLRRIAQNTSRLRWMLRYIDFIVKPDGESDE
jgi:hypothetical protein